MVHAEAYFLWNAAMCLCALPLGGKLAGLPAPGRGALAASAGLAGALSLCALVLPPLQLLALGSLPCAVALCFRTHGLGPCLRGCVTTLGASLILGGGAQALTARGVPAPFALLAGAGVALLVYLLATLLPGALCDVRQVELRVDGNAVILPAMLDSGNLLRDPVTGLPVLVVPRKAARLLFPGVRDPSDLASLPLGFRLLNVRTAAGSALLPLFRPDECRLYLNGHPSEARLLVAVAGPEYGGAQALVPMAALSASFS